MGRKSLTGEAHLEAMRLNFEYASKIRQYRVIMDMTMQQAADVIDCHSSAYNQKERGHGKLTAKDIEKMHRLFLKWRADRVSELQKQIDELLSID